MGNTKEPVLDLGESGLGNSLESRRSCIELPTSAQENQLLKRQYFRHKNPYAVNSRMPAPFEHQQLDIFILSMTSSQHRIFNVNLAFICDFILDLGPGL